MRKELFSFLKTLSYVKCGWTNNANLNVKQSFSIPRESIHHIEEFQLIAIIFINLSFHKNYSSFKLALSTFILIRNSDFNRKIFRKHGITVAIITDHKWSRAPAKLPLAPSSASRDISPPCKKPSSGYSEPELFKTNTTLARDLARA